MDKWIAISLLVAVSSATCRTSNPKLPDSELDREYLVGFFEIIDADTIKLVGRGFSKKHKTGSQAQSEAEAAARHHAVQDLVRIFGPYCGQLENLHDKKENELMKLMKIKEMKCRPTENGTICRVIYSLQQKGIQEKVESEQRDLPEKQKLCHTM